MLSRTKFEFSFVAASVVQLEELVIVASTQMLSSPSLLRKTQGEKGSAPSNGTKLVALKKITIELLSLLQVILYWEHEENRNPDKPASKVRQLEQRRRRGV